MEGASKGKMPGSKFGNKWRNRQGEDEGMINEEPDVDFYSILNVSRDTSEEELRKAYLKLSRTFHSDKVSRRSPTEVQHANERFKLIQDAYETLKDPRKRAIYNMYGVDGLDLVGQSASQKGDADDPMGEMMEYGNPEAIKRVFERLSRRKMVSEYMSSVNAKSKFSAQINLSDFWDPYSRRFMLPEIRSATSKHKFDTQLTDADRLTLGGALHLEPGNNYTQIMGGLQHVFSSSTVGNCKVVTSLKSIETTTSLAHAIDPLTTAKVELFWGTGNLLRFLESERESRMTLLVNRQLGSNISTSLQYSINRQYGSQMMAATEYVGESWMGTGSVASTMDEMQIHAGVEMPVSAATRVGVSGAATVFSRQFRFSLDCSMDVTSENTVGVSLDCGSGGLTLTFSYERLGQKFEVPVFLAEELSTTALVSAIAVPAVVMGLFNLVILAPRERRKKRERLLERRRMYKDIVARERIKAEMDVKLIEDTVKRRRVEEQTVDGLIIVEAKYGESEAMAGIAMADGKDCAAHPLIANVTTALQYQVKQSKLTLTSAPKSQLVGFYDPCPKEEKKLRVLYMYKSQLHGTTIDDLDELRIPQKRHLIRHSKA
mmetsp:Transcript_24466/g.68586  ORF Transcript_24466/g.68586 Transcript_24466/m.68586 type:complete len:602 (-) Transcript_24466:284-2089(-)|eukprot:CAMPEP_0119124902 /NCGR_PEP_ID=MMETSP1310-20130426/4366_1 /TAXON_ID=464262 /ORGANISM="Genus nov. species nov., Strain RCC2339" /LENGTH=601 /DNA_ID=CAMNT_0007114915 /DNA_START=131 /DNA_END=1936 /DNA_ORIENTATION=+